MESVRKNVQQEATGMNSSALKVMSLERLRGGDNPPAEADLSLVQTHEAVGDGDLMQGDVTVAVSHTTINYKDGLALTGKAPVIRRWPMIPGIDFAGTVVGSVDAQFKPGDEVVLNGWGVGETHYGGYAGRPASRATG